jgi:hypothetical protein
MPAVVTLTADVIANMSSLLSFRIVNEAGVGFQPPAVTLTLYEKWTRTILNGRDAVDVLSSVDASGNVSFKLTPADNALLVPDDLRQIEIHCALFEWQFNTTDKNSLTVEFTVKGLPYA